MSEIKHAVKGNGAYHLTTCGNLLGIAQKSDDGFTLEWATFVDTPQTFKTMKALKEFISKDLPEHTTKRRRRTSHLSVREACKIAGYSHNGTWRATANIEELWPNLPGCLYGDRILRLAMEAQATWPGNAHAHRWLKKIQRSVGMIPSRGSIGRSSWDGSNPIP